MSSKMEPENIPKFNGKRESFKKWKALFIDAMVRKSLDGLMSGQEQKPGARATEEAVKQWQAKNRKLYSYLHTYVDDRTAELFERNCQNGDYDLDGAAAWNYICQLYEEKTPLNMMLLLSRLLNTRLEGNGDMDDYLNSCVALANEINKIARNTISDQFVAILILRGLPDNFKNFVYMKCATNKVDLDNVLHELRNINTFEQTALSKEVDSEAFRVETVKHKPKFNGEDNRRERQSINVDHGQWNQQSHLCVKGIIQGITAIKDTTC